MIIPSKTYIATSQVFLSGELTTGESFESEVYRNGTIDTGVSVSQTYIGQGTYFHSWTMPADYDNTDTVIVNIKATVNGAVYPRIVFNSDDGSVEGAGGTISSTGIDYIVDIVDDIAAQTGAIGSEPLTMTVRDTGNVAIDNVKCWITSDSGNDNVIHGIRLTNSQGLVTFMLDTGAYYFWRDKDGHDFTNNPVYIYWDGSSWQT